MITGGVPVWPISMELHECSSLEGPGGFSSVVGDVLSVRWLCGPTGELCRKQNGFIMCAALQPKHVTSVEWGSGQRKGHVELVCA